MSAPPAAPLLDIRDLSVAYKGVTALEQVSLTVAPGEFVALLGPSGCGKTSLLRSVAGYVHPQAGVIRLKGTDVLRLPPRRRNIGMVFQSYALFPHLTVAENVRFGLRCRRVAAVQADRRVQEMLAIVGLGDFAGRRPAQLSGGQQQRVALARALVIQPDLLLLDEALGALDRKLRVEMQTELKTLQRRFGISTVFVTHDQEEAMAMADRIAVLRAGRIEQLDTPQDLFGRPRNAWTAEFIGAGNLLSARPGRAADGRIPLTVAPGCCFALPADAAVAEAQALTAYVRSDRVWVERCVGGEAALQVVGRRFLGAQVELRLQSGDVVLRALLPSERADAIELGTAVRAGARPEDCRVLDHA